MAQTRKDLRGRVLRKGESQRRSDERYVYTYTDPLGRRKYVYAQDLVTLREKEAQLMKDQMDGLDIYVAGKATVNFVFDRYMSLKNNLKPTTKSNYLYMYDRFIRDTFGKRNIAEIKYSDVVQFYNHLTKKQELKINTLETIHTLLHPTFQLAVRDDIIRKNPTDGVMAELKKNLGMKTGVRHALTIPQQRAFMEYIATHPIYFHWWPIFTIFLGTGCRIGEVLGLRWEDIDYEKRIISINHNLTYYPVGEDRASENHISTPKTEAGMRTIPMLDTVKDAFEMIWEEQKENGWTDAEIDGMTGFVFCNRYGNIMNAQSVNRAIKRISSAYNATEEIEAKKEHREPVLLPDFSAHSLRHTFCTRLCERETNLKIIQSIMGHKDIQTTMDIYGEATEEKKQETFEGKITMKEAQSLIDSYYEERPVHLSDDERTEEADKVSSRIVEILSETAFSFSPNEYIAIHRKLFQGIYKHAGKIRDYNITKKEWVLDGATVMYGSASELRATLEYVFSQEKDFSYKGLSMDEIIHHLAVFISRLWQIHIFGEGNTRTTAVFFIKYLRTLGFSATNDIFAENAWYFRNALVRANYTNLQKGIHETTEYLEAFLRNLLLNEKNELHNRNLHISELLNEEKVDIGDRKVDIENEKVDIQDKKVDIESVLSQKGSGFSVKTTVHIHRLFEKFGFDEVFGRIAVMEILELKGSGASKLLSNLVQADIIEPVSGYGKGKYKFKNYP